LSFQRVIELSQILIDHPEKKDKFAELLGTMDTSLSLFLKRAVASRMPRESEPQPCTCPLLVTLDS
jgi:hypothetical protein